MDACIVAYISLREGVDILFEGVNISLERGGGAWRFEPSSCIYCLRGVVGVVELSMSHERGWSMSTFCAMAPAKIVEARDVFVYLVD